MCGPLLWAAVQGVIVLMQHTNLVSSIDLRHEEHSGRQLRHDLLRQQRQRPPALSTQAALSDGVTQRRLQGTIPSVYGFVLQADGKDRAHLTDGIEVNRNLWYGMAINIKAQTSNTVSVRFALGFDSYSRIDSRSPYQLFSSSTTLSYGENIIAATPFSEKKGGGIQGETLLINITLVDGPIRYVPTFVGDAESALEYPFKVGESQGSLVGTELFSVGGFVTLSRGTPETYALDLSNETAVWRTTADAPIGFWTHGAVAVKKDKFFMCGGYLGKHPGRAMRDCFAFDKSAGTIDPNHNLPIGTWTRMKDLPEGRGGGGMVYIQGHEALLFSMGAERLDNSIQSTVDRNNTWVLHLGDENADWEEKGPGPYLGNHLTAVAASDCEGNDHYYFLGGQVLENEASGNIASNFEYLPDTDKWVERTPMPFGRGHFSYSAVPYGCGFIIVGGAYDGDPTKFSKTNDVHYYDITSDTWIQIGDWTRNSKTSVCAIYDDTLWCTNGYRTRTDKRQLSYPVPFGSALSKSPSSSPAPTITNVADTTPSNAPTTGPSGQPTTVPAAQTSASALPSSKPSNTSSPLTKPSMEPSFNPTNGPTGLPTISPTAPPIIEPTTNPAVAPISGVVLAITLANATFPNNEEGFVYQDDVFRGTSEPSYAKGAYEARQGKFGSGCLSVRLGGVNNKNIFDMSGGWLFVFTLLEPAKVTVTFDYHVELPSQYDVGEYAEVLVGVDNTTLTGRDGFDYITRLMGGLGGYDTPYETVSLDLGLLTAGSHSLTFGGYNNRKTTKSEQTILRFDDITVTKEVKEIPLTGPPPTSAPSVAPTNLSTVQPSERFTSQPTLYPSEPPTTSSPTKEPTLSSLSNQTDSPTYQPTMPTGSPLMNMTILTSPPIADPTVGPSLSQTSEPTLVPPPNQTDSPTQQPMVPTGFPTMNITAPTLVVVPTVGPSPLPTTTKGEAPTNEPTSSPSLNQTNSPTYQPTMPTGFPTMNTTAPTSSPISDPTAGPSFLPAPGEASLVTLVNATFDSDEEDCVYLDDTFRATSEPSYARGLYEASEGKFGSGCLAVKLGGINNKNIFDMSGGWVKTFTLVDPARVLVTFDFRVLLPIEYDAGEHVDVLVALDSTTLVGSGDSDYIVRLLGGEGGYDTAFETVSLDLGVLDSGPHFLIFGGYNNRKTTKGEVATLRFDDITVSAAVSSSSIVQPDQSARPSALLSLEPSLSPTKFVVASDPTAAWSRMPSVLPSLEPSSSIAPSDHVVLPTPTTIPTNVQTEATTSSSLTPGDIAIVQYNADGLDNFAFVAFVSIPPGTAIMFTDRGWRQSGGFFGAQAGVEGVLQWTATEAISLGTVVTIGAKTETATSGTAILVDGIFDLNSWGDQIFAFQLTTADAINLLFAINNQEDGWQSDATTLATSADPASLPLYAKMAMIEIDNAAYNGLTSGTRDELLAAITDRTNWIGQDVGQATSSGPFTVVPE